MVDEAPSTPPQVSEGSWEQLLEMSRPLSAQILLTLSNLLPQDVDRLRQLWPRAPVERRQEIARRLVALGEENVELSFDAFFRLGLEDPDGEVREQAVLGLWECEERAIIAPLCALLRTDDEEPVRSAAAQVLGQFALRAELGKLLPRDAQRVVQTLLEAAEDSEEEIDVRRRAIEALGPISSSEVRRILRESYEGADDRLRAGALHAMGRNGDGEWLPVILDELESPSSTMRFEAATAAGLLGSFKALAGLLPLIDDEDSEVQEAAVNALGRIGGARATEVLRRCLDHPSTLVREAAAEALEQIRAQQAPLSLLGDDSLAQEEEDEEEEEE